MKSKLIKYFFTLFFFCSSLTLFAIPGTDTEESDIESTEESLPIDDYVGLLATMGALFIFMKLKQDQNKKAKAIEERIDK